MYREQSVRSCLEKFKRRDVFPLPFLTAPRLQTVRFKSLGGKLSPNSPSSGKDSGMSNRLSASFLSSRYHSNFHLNFQDPRARSNQPSLPFSGILTAPQPRKVCFRTKKEGKEEETGGRRPPVGKARFRFRGRRVVALPGRRSRPRAASVAGRSRGRRDFRVGGILNAAMSQTVQNVTLSLTLPITCHICLGKVMGDARHGS